MIAPLHIVLGSAVPLAISLLRASSQLPEVKIISQLYEQKVEIYFQSSRVEKLH